MCHVANADSNISEPSLVEYEKGKISDVTSLEKAKQAAKNDSLTLKRIEFLEKGLTEAILATNCRKAQIVMEKEKTKAAKAEFRQAWVKLNNYRNLTEKDMILDVGKARFREQTGCNWPKK